MCSGSRSFLILLSNAMMLVRTLNYLYPHNSKLGLNFCHLWLEMMVTIQHWCDVEAKSIVILPLPQSFYSAIFSPEAIALHLQAINTVNLAIFMDTGSVMTSKNAFQWHPCNDFKLRRNISNPWQSQGSECGKLVKREEWESFHTIRKYWQSELNPVRGNLDDICYEEV